MSKLMSPLVVEALKDLNHGMEAHATLIRAAKTLFGTLSDTQKEIFLEEVGRSRIGKPFFVALGGELGTQILIRHSSGAIQKIESYIGTLESTCIDRMQYPLKGLSWREVLRALVDRMGRSR